MGNTQNGLKNEYRIYRVTEDHIRQNQIANARQREIDERVRRETLKNLNNGSGDRKTP